jgi:hypothetical protein
MNAVFLVLQPPPSLGIELPGGRTIIIAPASREKLTAAAACDSPTVPDEERRGRVLAALVGPRVGMIASDGTEEEIDSSPILSTLTPAQEMALIAALEAQVIGIDPTLAVALHKVSLVKYFLQETANEGTAEGM